MLKILKELTLLIVEDDAQMRENLKEIMGHFFKKIVTAESGQEGLKVYESGMIDIIFSDYEMPFMNADEFVREIRMRDKNIPIAIISNYDDKDKLKSVIALNLLGYIVKPIEYETIKVFLKNVELYFEQNGLIEQTISKNISVNFNSSSIIVGDKVSKLSSHELKFVKLLLNNKNRIVNKTTIEDYVFSFDCTEDSVKNIVYRLKKKCAALPLKNIKEVGYILIDAE